MPWFFYVWCLFLFVVVGEGIRRDAIKEGAPPNHAWFIGLFFACFSLTITVVLMNILM